MNQRDFLVCVAAGFLCAGYMSLRWWVEEGRKEGRMIRWSSRGKNIFFFFFGNQGGNDGKVWRREGEDAHLWWDLFWRERGMECILL